MKFLLIFFTIFFLVSCDNGNDYIIETADKKFTAFFPIRVNPNNETDRYWIPSIKNSRGDIIYRDEVSKYSGFQKIYFAWDEDNNLWLYESDRQLIYIYLLENETWKKIVYDKSMGLKPPSSIIDAGR